MALKIRKTPIGVTSKENRVRSPSKALIFEHVRRTDDDDDLQEVARELGAPDHTVGNGSPKEVGKSEAHDHIESPIYPDALPWEKVKVKAPYKLRK